MTSASSEAILKHITNFLLEEAEYLNGYIYEHLESRIYTNLMFDFSHPHPAQHYDTTVENLESLEKLLEQFNMRYLGVNYKGKLLKRALKALTNNKIIYKYKTYKNDYCSFQYVCEYGIEIYGYYYISNREIILLSVYLNLSSFTSEYAKRLKDYRDSKRIEKILLTDPIDN